MARPTEAHIQIAKRLLAQDGAGGDDAKERAAAAGHVYDALFESLAPVIGGSAVRALVARSVKLTKADYPGLGELTAGGPLGSNTQIGHQLLVCLSKLEPAAASEAATALYATLFGLMTTFIGERLTWQLVKNAFPAVDEMGSKETTR